ncbi:ABC transporter ATP-binding protein [Streptomyces sp. NBC_00385]|uniref:ABC transporter ATP-binding protein n=1 Tax=Streptomyces sp. NBC_00385 TaxID=2975733 RepID=UPI002DDC5821|nr:ABC transporter ATP-binding protein [Streptomyces sp. NBC_00385]WRZ01932.1 ABC transporter ATP-binding protein [Streptomyces sp. NBC_00385]
MPLLHTDDVTVAFGGRRALDNVSLDVEAGRITGLIGPNGAGKSTFFDVVSGLRRPETGRVVLDGEDITSLGPARRARRGMARTFQHLELFGRLSVRDNLLVAAELGPGRRHASRTVNAVLARLGIEDSCDDLADSLPTGTARLVEVGRALVLEPRVLLLDEPAAGQDAQETERFAAMLRDLAAEGTAVLLVEHDMSLVMSVCDRIHVLDLGVVVAGGPPADIQRNRAVLAAYLGEG